MKLFDDFRLHFRFKIDYSTPLHFLREFVITLCLSAVNPIFAVGFALGVDTAWEWQDGKREGFDIADWLAGLFGICAGVLLRRWYYGS